MSNLYAPCQLVEHENGSYSLIFDDFDRAADIFEEMGYEAGGYAWHGVADALVRTHAPELQTRVKYDPESSMFAAYGTDRDALGRLAELIRTAVDDPVVLRAAIESANPELMD